MACGHGSAGSNGNSSAAGGSAGEATGSANATPAPPSQDDPRKNAPPASETGGFDGAKAYDFTTKIVSFGPRPPTSDALHRSQEYIHAQLQSFGCTVDEDDFHASTPVGELAMKNIVAKMPGEGKGIILLLTHYDTLKMDNFVGAVDGGSSTGLMLEMARVICGGKKEPNAVWIAFVDGEEALVNWNKDNDNTYGSRQMAALMAASGDLKRIRAVILADMVGPKNPRFLRDSNSTDWLTDLVWNTAAHLGYQSVFIDGDTPVSDDHESFLNRRVPAVDIIDLIDYPYWHTTQDTMDKVSARSLAIAGHVILETVNELQKKFR